MDFFNAHSQVNDVRHYIVNGDMISLVGEAFINGKVVFTTYDTYDTINNYRHNSAYISQYLYYGDVQITGNIEISVNTLNSYWFHYTTDYYFFDKNITSWKSEQIGYYRGEAETLRQYYTDEFEPLIRSGFLSENSLKNVIKTFGLWYNNKLNYNSFGLDYGDPIQGFSYSTGNENAYTWTNIYRDVVTSFKTPAGFSYAFYNLPIPTTELDAGLILIHTSTKNSPNENDLLVDRMYSQPLNLVVFDIPIASDTPFKITKGTLYLSDYDEKGTNITNLKNFQSQRTYYKTKLEDRNSTTAQLNPEDAQNTGLQFISNGETEIKYGDLVTINGTFREYSKTVVNPSTIEIKGTLTSDYFTIDNLNLSWTSDEKSVATGTGVVSYRYRKNDENILTITQNCQINFSLDQSKPQIEVIVDDDYKFFIFADYAKGTVNLGPLQYATILFDDSDNCWYNDKGYFNPEAITTVQTSLPLQSENPVTDLSNQVVAKTDISIATAIEPIQTSVQSYNASDDTSAWETIGSVDIVQTETADTLTFTEGEMYVSMATSSISLDSTLGKFAFTIDASFVQNSDNQPQDAFEVALLDPESGKSLITIDSETLSDTDAFFNLQSDGTYYMASGISLIDAQWQTGEDSNKLDLSQPFTVVINTKSIQISSPELSFALLPFDDAKSFVTVTIPTQQSFEIHKIYSEDSNYKAYAGKYVTIPVMYKTTSEENNQTSLELKIHYDSSKLTYYSIGNLFGTDYVNSLKIIEDTDNTDDDSSTDRILYVSWYDKDGNWTCDAEQLLMNLCFQVNDKVSGSTTINYTASSTDGHILFENEPTTISFQNEEVKYSGVIVQTPSSTDYTDVLPQSLNQLLEWSTFNVELWTNATASSGTWTFDITYDRSLFEPVLSNSVGCLGSEISWTESIATDTTSRILSVTIKVPEKLSNDFVLARIGSIEFKPATKTESIQNTGISIGDESRNIGIQVADESLSTQVVAVPYDLDDSNKIDSEDFLEFATLYGSRFDKNGSYNKADFNHSGKVDSQDFIDFATNYGASLARESKIVLPTMINATQTESKSALNSMPIESTITNVDSHSNSTVTEETTFIEKTVATAQNPCSYAQLEITEKVKKSTTDISEKDEQPLLDNVVEEVSVSTADVQTDTSSHFKAIDSVFDNWDESESIEEDDTIDFVIEPVIKKMI